MGKFNFFKSVLLGTLIVVFLCGCSRSTVDYIIADEIQMSEMESDSEAINEENFVETISESETEIQLLYVYVCGEVKSPGVYTLPEGSRVCDVFSMADGFTADAAIDYWNQARLLKDGEMIYVPTIDEAKERKMDGVSETDISIEDDAEGKININTASKAQLMTIPGIGEAKASAIVMYREKNGTFSSIEEVKKVEGIKEGVYEKMKEYIVVD